MPTPLSPPQALSTAWPALAAARAHDPALRLPFLMGGQRAGSVARAHLPALLRWPDCLTVTPQAVELHGAVGERDGVLADINRHLNQARLIHGWRNELFAVPALGDDDTPLDVAPLATIERAAARFWGLLTLGAHGTGYVRNAQGEISHLWVAQRSDQKSTDPGMWDNLIGGGVPAGQSPLQTLVREGWEEAGLAAPLLAGVTSASVLRLCRDLQPEPGDSSSPAGRMQAGLQREHLHCFDLPLAADVVPINQDGEVQRFACLPVAQALKLAASGAMTVDAALVTLDFCLRHRLCTAPSGAAEVLPPWR